MKLWLISQGEQTGYDTFDSAVVAAETEEEAKKTPPFVFDGDSSVNYWTEHHCDWASSPEQVDAEYLGEAVAGTEAGVVLASFNAG